MTDIKLKPCPFCGGEATLFYNNSWMVDRKLHYVMCVNKNCAINPSTGPMEFESEAAEAWNTRYTENEVKE